MKLSKLIKDLLTSISQAETALAEVQARAAKLAAVLIKAEANGETLEEPKCRSCNLP